MAYKDKILDSIDGKRLGYNSDRQLISEGRVVARFNAAGTGIEDPNKTDGSVLSLGGGGGIAAGRTLTASATLQLTDANTLITSNHATVAQVYTIPNDATVAWPVLTYISLYQQGAAAASFTAGAGTTIQGAAPTAGVGVVSGLLKVSANTWTYA